MFAAERIENSLRCHALTQRAQRCHTEVTADLIAQRIDGGEPQHRRHVLRAAPGVAEQPRSVVQPHPCEQPVQRWKPGILEPSPQSTFTAMVELGRLGRRDPKARGTRQALPERAQLGRRQVQRTVEEMRHCAVSQGFVDARYQASALTGLANRKELDAGVNERQDYSRIAALEVAEAEKCGRAVSRCPDGGGIVVRSMSERGEHNQVDGTRTQRGVDSSGPITVLDIVASAPGRAELQRIVDVAPQRGVRKAGQDQGHEKPFGSGGEPAVTSRGWHGGCEGKHQHDRRRAAPAQEQVQPPRTIA
jgi:hypothetical protein